MKLGVPLPQGSSTHNLQRLARGMKLGSSDSSSILRVYETALGRTVKLMTSRAPRSRAAALGALLGVPFLASAAAADVWSALRTAGHFALIRHAAAPGVLDPPGFKLDDCTSQRNLFGWRPRPGDPHGRPFARQRHCGRTPLVKPVVPLPRHRDAR